MIDKVQRFDQSKRQAFRKMLGLGTGLATASPSTTSCPTRSAMGWTLIVDATRGSRIAPSICRGTMESAPRVPTGGTTREPPRIPSDEFHGGVALAAIDREKNRRAERSRSTPAWAKSESKLSVVRWADRCRVRGSGCRRGLERSRPCGGRCACVMPGGLP